MLSFLKLACLMALLMFAITPARAELVVIVNVDRDIDYLSHEEVVNIFMGRYRKLAEGISLQPLDIKGDAPERRDFYAKLLDKSLAEINAYWARLIFSGRTSPPLALTNQSEVIERIAHDSNAIGYVERKNLNAQVKIVFTLPE
jgi:hypothetical protein